MERVLFSNILNLFPIEKLISYLNYKHLFLIIQILYYTLLHYFILRAYLLFKKKNYHIKLTWFLLKQIKFKFQITIFYKYISCIYHIIVLNYIIFKKYI